MLLRLRHVSFVHQLRAAGPLMTIFPPRGSMMRSSASLASFKLYRMRNSCSKPKWNSTFTPFSKEQHAGFSAAGGASNRCDGCFVTSTTGMPRAAEKPTTATFMRGSTLKVTPFRTSCNAAGPYPTRSLAGAQNNPQAPEAPPRSPHADPRAEARQHGQAQHSD